MTQNNPITPITEDDIANFLVNTPDFFLRHAEVLAQVRIVSPHGQRAVSLQERQADMLREKIRALETRLMEMIRNGNENLILTDRLHRWAKNLLMVTDPVALPKTILMEIQQQFMVPQVAMKLWHVSEAFVEMPFAQGVSPSVKDFANTLKQPYCGPNSGFEAISWLEDAKAVQSIAMVNLRPLKIAGHHPSPVVSMTQETNPLDAPTAVTSASLSKEEPQIESYGLLVFASPDPQRYHAGMGTDFLERIGELASAALMQLWNP
jgi:hypothetical protein